MLIQPSDKPKTTRVRAKVKDPPVAEEFDKKATTNGFAAQMSSATDGDDTSCDVKISTDSLNKLKANGSKKKQSVNAQYKKTVEIGEKVSTSPFQSGLF